ncbi:hypothetical protein EYZ11_011488 [Aspergillus tanneri]|uniref:Uncharacterized protein n=1 Tax=Aspergillus tanneri TaxID=1220188 RepID=A0A4S3J7Z6_9EURO|nr:uncharacterized protein ATNIH1004_007843 [Aspergillus tanneri]KAA8646413.1 hypothetical protein ATNIH1004_007843 [Aspergillus tanneri]THC89061.1 hypothetical protein EYZ11_011488 [Aspergillus tanneri]
MKETVEETGEDVSDIDGFQELSPENQEKVRKAVEQGHVDDDDWKGDVEMNRPGKTGFRMRVPKKKAKADEVFTFFSPDDQVQQIDDPPQEEEVSEAREQPAKPKKRGQAKPAKDAAKSGSEDEAPKTKQPKKRGRAKQDVVDDDESAKQPAKKGRASKDTTEKKTTKTSTASTPAAKSNAKRQKKPANEDGEAEAKLVPADEKPKRGRKKKSM